jgi:hypothetical protein
VVKRPGGRLRVLCGPSGLCGCVAVWVRAYAGCEGRVGRVGYVGITPRGLEARAGVGKFRASRGR